MRTLGSALVGLLVTMGSPTSAAEAPRLPEFTVQAPGGPARAGASLAPAERWLLVYVTPDCRPCEALVVFLDEQRTPGLVAGTVLLIGADTEQAQEWITRTLPAGLEGVAWYADADGSAWEALVPGGAPVVFGVAGGRIAWTARGLMTRSGVLGPAVRTWME